MCTACEGYELSQVVSSPNYVLESILCGPGGLCSMSLYKYSDQTEANFQRKGLLQENYAVCQVHFSQGLNKVA